MFTIGHYTTLLEANVPSGSFMHIPKFYLTISYLQVKQRMETDEDAHVVKMNCYFINYRTFVNIVKYKLDHMRKKMEVSERDETSRASFKCLGCGKNFTDLEANQLLEPTTGEMRYGHYIRMGLMLTTLIMILVLFWKLKKPLSAVKSSDLLK